MKDAIASLNKYKITNTSENLQMQLYNQSKL